MAELRIALIAEKTRRIHSRECVCASFCVTGWSQVANKPTSGLMNTTGCGTCEAERSALIWLWPNVALVEGWTPATREAGWQLGSYRDLSAESYPSYVDARARCEWKDAKYLAKHNWQVAADAGYPHQEGTLPWALPIRAPARDARAIRWAVVGRIGQGFGWGWKTGRRTWRTGRLRRISWLAVSDSKLRDRHLGRSTRGHRGNLTARPAGKSVPEQTCAFHAGAGSAWRAHIDPTGSGATNRERVTARCGLHCACSPRSSL